MTRLAMMALVALATLLVAVHAVLASRLGVDSDAVIMHFTWVEVVIYGLAAMVVLRDRGGEPTSRRALAGILVIAAVVRFMLLFVDPVSTDINRYIWDGRVQAAGINPYLYVPADPALQALRDDEIYPEINRKTYAHTIYPPLAQAVFFLVTRISESVPAMKAAMVGFEAIAAWAILRLLKLRNLPPTRILLYLWHPLPVWEFAGSGHVDAVAIACVSLGLLAAELRRPALAGIALGGAALVKFFPAVVAPALYRRWDWRLPLAGVVTVVVLYLPYLGAGTKVLGFLSGYGAEEGLADGSGFYPWVLLHHILPGLPPGAAKAYPVLAAAMLAAIGLYVLFRRPASADHDGGRRSGADLAGAFLLATTFTVLTSPHFPWYLAWLVPFLCFMPSLAVVWLTGSATLMYVAGWPPSFAGGSFFYLPFLALLAIDVTICRLRPKAKRHGNTVPV